VYLRAEAKPIEGIASPIPIAVTITGPGINWRVYDFLDGPPKIDAVFEYEELDHDPHHNACAHEQARCA
jgi:hypothetical protein